MDRKGYENHINNILKKQMQKSESGVIPRAKNAAFNKYGLAWATTIAIDIVGFKEILNRYDRKWVINILQAFSSTAIKIGKENPNFISAYVNGDEVILNFSAESKNKITENYETALKINSAINYLFETMLKKNKYNLWNGVGIGVWTTKDNSIVKYGERGTELESFNTLIGDSIVYASYAAKLANRPRYTNQRIIMNGTTKINIDKNKPSIAKGWIKEVKISNDESLKSFNLYGASVLYGDYEG